MSASVLNIRAISEPHAMPVAREWLAHLHLDFAPRRGKTALVASDHKGPLRVQRPFYPEPSDCCHMYLLHPPGGLVIGDQLDVNVTAAAASRVLLTTPSAGKVYGAKGASQKQAQNIELHIDDACVEWLPQETIIFNGANARLNTRLHICESSRFLCWDIVRLGRVASGDYFVSGSCIQNLQVWKNGRPYFIEKNRLFADHPIAKSTAGYQHKNTFATLLASVQLPRERIDELLECLQSVCQAANADDNAHWALTQKRQLFVARYLGNSILECRAGFELLWTLLRPELNGLTALKPRIWAT